MCEMNNPDNSARVDFYNRQDEEMRATIPEDIVTKPDLSQLEREAELAPNADKIDAICKELAFFLKVKNFRYNDSARDPINICSNACPEDQINDRMDDKLRRIKQSDIHRKNDFVDLGGYIILKCDVNNWTDFKDLLD